MSNTTTASRPVKPRRPLTPATGSCRWLIQPGLAGTPGLLSITVKVAGGKKEVSEVYAVTAHKEAGYRLTKPDGTAYDLSPGPEFWECECGDYTFNRAHATTPETRECKHCRGVRKALAELN
jgi:hypothetical protein